MNILLLGASGQVGCELRSTLKMLGTVVAPARPDVDFSDTKSLRAVVRRYRPSIVVNAGGKTSWHGLACHVIAKAGPMGLPLQASAETIAPIATADCPTPAKRPTYSRLATSKLRNNFSVALPEWTVGVNAVVNQIVPEMRQ